MGFEHVRDAKSRCEGRTRRDEVLRRTDRLSRTLETVWAKERCQWRIQEQLELGSIRSVVSRKPYTGKSSSRSHAFLVGNVAPHRTG